MASRYGDLDVIETLVRFGDADPMSVFQPNLDGQEPRFIDRFDDETLMKRVRDTPLSLESEKIGAATA